MIKVVKDITQIPQSLIPAFRDLFPERAGRSITAIPLTSRTTHQKRMEVIASRVYTDHVTFNSRYKLADIKDKLLRIYKGKCAFCEQKAEIPHIEHYRPKITYYWLAYSWDNLLMSCPMCNLKKGENFAIDGNRAIFNNTEINIRSINTCSANHDSEELPKMVNPEVTDPHGHIHFEKNGKIQSDHPRFKYTIQKCEIDRTSLNDSRRAILDRFREHIRDALLVNTNLADQKTAISTNIRNFVRDSENENESFLAFRRYALNNNWLNEIIKDQN